MKSSEKQEDIKIK